MASDPGRPPRAAWLDLRRWLASDGVLWRSPAALASLVAVALARLLALPRSPGEWDELLFVRGVESFQPLAHRPHPPGYPLLIGLGKEAAWLFGDPFRGLVWLSVVASLVGHAALVSALSGPPDERGARAASAVHGAVAGALLFSLSPSMLVHGAMALSDAPALCFVALALAFSVGLTSRPSTVCAALCGGSAAAAVGCRPQLAVAVVPMLVVALWLVGSRGQRQEPRALRRALFGAGLAGFAAVTLAWLVPLVRACGGLEGLLSLLRRQAGLVAAHDAALARAHGTAVDLLVRFVLDPWGPRWASVAVLGLAMVGGYAVARGRLSWMAPLLLFGMTDLAFALAVMNPDEGPRYALPAMMAVAALAGLGGAAVAPLLRARALGPVALAALLGGFVAFTAPVLRQRAGADSPPVRAAAWARGHLPPGALVLYDRQLESFAQHLLPAWKRIPADSRLPCRWRGPMFLFAEGTSPVPDAPTFAWLSGPAWERLTPGRYAVVSWTPVERARLFEPGAGVYGPEPSALAVLAAGSDVDSWRWLAEEAWFRVCPGGAGALELGFRLPANVPYGQIHLTIEVAASPPTSLTLARGDRASVRLALPVGRRTRVDVSADRGFVPDTTGITRGDRRRLAVQLVEARLVSSGPR